MTNNWWILTDKDRCSRKCRRCKGPEHRKRTQKTTKWNLPLLTSRIFSISGQWSSCYVHDWLLLIIFTEHSHSCKANSSSVCQQIPCILQNLKVHYHIHNSPPLVPLRPSQFFENYFSPLNAELNSICHLLALLRAHHILQISTIRVNSSLPTRPFFSKQSLFFRFYHQNPVCNIFLPLTRHKPCTSHSPWFDHLDKISGEEHKSQSSSSCNFLQSPVISSLLGKNTFLRTGFYCVHFTANEHEQNSSLYFWIVLYVNCLSRRKFHVNILYCIMQRLKILLHGSL